MVSLEAGMAEARPTLPQPHGLWPGQGTNSPAALAFTFMPLSPDSLALSFYTCLFPHLGLSRASGGTVASPCRCPHQACRLTPWQVFFSGR